MSFSEIYMVNKVIGKRPGNMVNAFVLFSLCLWHLVDLTKELKSVSVMKGDSVTLHSDVTETQQYNLVQWMFGSSRIADINRITQTSSIYDKRFKDRVKLDQTGSLTITNTRTTDSGLYQLAIISRETSYTRFNVKVYDVKNKVKTISVMEGDSVSLNTDVTEEEKYLLIQWMFGGNRIAEVSRLTQTNMTYDGPDGRFRDRLKLDQTGSLTIINSRTTDSGLYKLAVVSGETSYTSFKVKVYERSSSPSCVSSTINRTEDANITELYQPSSDVTNEVKTVSVMEGDSVSLNTDVTKEGKYLLIQWMFGSTQIAEVSRLKQTNKTYDGPDGRFRDRLKLDETGSLTITNSRTTDSGLYKLAVLSGETSYTSFNLTVCDRSSSPNYVSPGCVVNNSIINQTEDANITELYQSSSDVTNEVKTVSVIEGDSVSLNTDVTEEKKYLLIQWMFGSTRIAEVSSLTQTNTTYDGPDGRFRDRLKVDQTGSLTITNSRTTDSGLYKLAVLSGDTSYMSFNLTVYERSSSLNCVSSSCAVNNSTINQTEDANITELYQPSSDHVHCCGFTEAVIRLIVSVLVGVATVAFLFYDIKSTRSELNRMEVTIRPMEEN
ncbi:uncharacterized protein LOC127153141 [Labeo rohita]|uniref:uncharacterized protein LOC127153141 n=1 Tax=Labeo rohita TaxID=84645 RepID=UPI0021E25CD7|nr:uncharacterized protein LOC127153141 [Labeo rohita]